MEQQLNQFSESSLTNQPTTNCYRLWLTKHHPPITPNSSFDGLKSLQINSFLNPNLVEEEEEEEEKGQMSGHSTTTLDHKTHPLHTHHHQHPRGTTTLKVLIKRLSLSLLKTRSFLRARSQPEELSTLHSLNHPGPSRIDPLALVFGDENIDQIDHISNEFYKTFFPSLILD